LREAAFRFRRLRFAPYLFPNDREENLSPVRCAAMFEQKNALPGSELHFMIDNRHRLAGARQDHADMRWHVITAFGAVREIVRVLRHEPIEEFFQITSRSRIGILHDDHAATRVLNKHGRRPVSHTALVDLRLHIVRDLVQSLSVGANFKLFVMNVHCQPR
jgi:hypothetical protein